MTKSYRIISFEAANIYKDDNPDVKTRRPLLPQNDPDKQKFYDLFDNMLDESLDLRHLQKVYESIITDRPFAFEDLRGNDCTLAVINVKFSQNAKEYDGEGDNANSKELLNTKSLRKYLYTHGFDFNGVHYVRYKRSAGSSRGGKCLFIDERLLAAMEQWGECGLNKKDGSLASWEAYKALSLSAIKGLINIPLKGILFIRDCERTFEEEVVSVSLDKSQPRVDNGTYKLRADRKVCAVTNNIWDGESLLDESMFSSQFCDVKEIDKKHMLLLRNKFFKSCAFRTKLQDWFRDKHITLDDLKKRDGFVTLADRIEDIVMVTTESSLKYLKFAGDLSYETVKRWFDAIDKANIDDVVCSSFGVVKWDKRTTFFNGKMVRSSYQLLNTLALTRDQVDQLLQPSKDYIKTIRNDMDFMRYHFSDVCAKEPDGYDEDDDSEKEGLVEHAEALFALMDVNADFAKTKLYYKFRDKLVETQKNFIRDGHVLLHGTNATLFGNGPELLMHLAGVEGKDLVSVLGRGEVYSNRFADGAKLVGARSPHVTMGNLYCVTNNRQNDIWRRYFDLGDNIVCINAIGENSQQRLNGCDYDSDTVLITDDPLIVEVADKYKDKFLVPVCHIETSKTIATQEDVDDNARLVALDYNTSVNKVGDIVNLSQKRNSIIWHALNTGVSFDKVWELYMDVCKLAVLSGIEIDKAKKSYDEVDVNLEMRDIRENPLPNLGESTDSKIGDCQTLPPKFFMRIDQKTLDRFTRGNRSNNGDKKKLKADDYKHYETAMEYVCDSIKTVNFKLGCPARQEKMAVSEMFNFSCECDDKELKQVNEIVEQMLADQGKVSKTREERKKKREAQKVSPDVLAAVNVVEQNKNETHKLRAMRGKLNLGDEELSPCVRESIRAIKAKLNEDVDKLITNERIFLFALKAYEEKRGKEKEFLNWDAYAPILGCSLARKIMKDNRQLRPNIEPRPSGEYTLYCFNYTKKHQS